MKKIREKISLHPIMTFIIMIGFILVLSAFLSFLGLDVNYNKVNPNTGEYVNNLVTIESLLSIDGLKYIFSQTVANFVQFTPLSMLIIILMGIGIMEKSGFLKTAFTLLTRNIKKDTVTFILVITCILASIIGDLSYVIFIPLSALLFLHGKRNPLVGLITAFAALTCGSGINLLFTANDSAILNLTLQAAHILDSSYTLGIWSWLFVMILSVIALTIAITKVSEKIIAPMLGKYEINEDISEDNNILEEDHVIDTYERRGMIASLIGGLTYVAFILYNIIPGLPLSGRLVDDSQVLYIDKLFSYDSFFSNGFVFIVAIFFVICGLCYGIGAKTIKNNRDFCNDLGHSLDGVGKTLVLIFFASTFISIFKQSNIGTLLVAKCASIFAGIQFGGIPLIITFFIFVAIVTILVPTSVAKWSVLVGSVMPVMMNAGISPEFTQFIFRLAESSTLGLTPLFAYFVIYLAFVEKYNQSDKPVGLFKTIRYQLPYTLVTLIVFIIIIGITYLIGLPIGIDGIVNL